MKKIKKKCVPGREGSPGHFSQMTFPVVDVSNLFFFLPNVKENLSGSTHFCCCIFLAIITVIYPLSKNVTIPLNYKLLVKSILISLKV